MVPCNWQLVVCGINHKTSKLEEREPLQIGHEELAEADVYMSDLPGIRETVILSTCNRIEFYFVVSKDSVPCQIVSDFYIKFKKRDITGLRDNFYYYTDLDAAEHLFRVTAGIDSMVIGENQIVGQVRDAYRTACTVKSAGKIIHRLFHQTFRIGKQVRSDTELGKGACSVSSATVDMLKSRMTDIENPTVLFVGINRMIGLAASGLHRRGNDHFLFANRTREKAVDFAVKYKATGHALDEIPELIREADIVVSCTSSETPLINDITLAYRNGSATRPLIIADMAIPRDVELKEDHPGVTVYDLEDVREHVKNSQEQRVKAIPQAETLIKERLEQFKYWYEHIQHEPAMNGLGETFEQVRRQELGKALDALDDEARETVDRASRRLVEKLLHMKLRADASK